MMTPERALQILNHEIYASPGEMGEAMEMAREALGKQINRTVCYEGDGYDEDGNMIYDTAYCTNCGEKFEVDYDSDKKYCPECGQKLDWSGENDREPKIRYTSTYSCPACGGGFSGTGIAKNCYYCGQKIDWSGEG